MYRQKRGKMNPKKQSQQVGAQKKATTKRAGKLSLHPMEFEDALAALLNTPPPPKPTKKKSATKKRATKR